MPRARSTPETSASAKSAERARAVQRILGILHKWGIHTVGQLAALGKDDLGARLGPQAVRLWERASGKTTRLLQLVRPPESFEEAIEFEHEIETSEPLLFMLRRFLEQLAARLDALYLVSSELQLRLTFSNKTEYAHRFEIPDPTNSVEVLFRMLHAHLEEFKSEHPIIALALAAQPAKPRDQQFDLFETPLRDSSRLYETLTRLTGLLGAERVGTPVLENTHRPDAFRMEPFAWQLDPSAPLNEPLPTSALRRFRQLPESVRKNDVRQRRGPYCSSGNWWDGGAWERAEWDVQLPDGTIGRCHESPHGFRVDGIYD